MSNANLLLASSKALKNIKVGKNNLLLPESEDLAPNERCRSNSNVNVNTKHLAEENSSFLTPNVKYNKNEKQEKAAPRKSIDSGHKITRMLSLMSFSYAILNLPYFLSWSIFFMRVAFNDQLGLVERFQMFSVLNICEIFYILNYFLVLLVSIVRGAFNCRMNEFVIIWK